MYTEEIHNLLTIKFLEESFQDCFLVGIEQHGKTISVFLDSDTVISFDRCKAISRFLENEFDQNNWFGTDYILEVSSAGIDRPLTFPRQFIKNIGRGLSINTIDSQEFNGTLISADQEQLTLSWEEIRKEKNKKIKEIHETKIPYSSIKEAKIIVKI